MLVLFWDYALVLPFSLPYTRGHVGVVQVCIMLHSGSRGLGHQVATDALTAMDRAMSRDGIKVNDRQLACTRIHSKVPPAPEQIMQSQLRFLRSYPVGSNLLLSSLLSSILAACHVMSWRTT